MPRRVKDFIEISDYTSLDTLIRYLKTIRDNLPDDCEPELKLGGDDVFGRRLTISFLRELTEEESQRQARYTGAVIDDEPNVAIDQLRAKLDKVPFNRSDGSAG